MPWWEENHKPLYVADGNAFEYVYEGVNVRVELKFRVSLGYPLTEWQFLRCLCLGVLQVPEWPYP